MDRLRRGNHCRVSVDLTEAHTGVPNPSRLQYPDRHFHMTCVSWLPRPGERAAGTVFMKFTFSRASRQYLVQPPTGDLNPLSLFSCPVNLSAAPSAVFYLLLRRLGCASHRAQIHLHCHCEFTFTLQDYATLTLLF